MSDPIELETPHGVARAFVQGAERPLAALALGHGAGGGVGSPDLMAATRAALEARVSVALIEQPYRVAGRRSPAPAPQLDTAWIAAVSQLCEGPLAGLPLIAGGRSSGARVACRTSRQTSAVALVCLAFPVHPPGRPEQSRLDELDAVEVPVLVVQGDRDPFGMPPDAPGRTVAVVPGNHSLRSAAEVAAVVSEWLGSLVATRAA